ncbi:MAG: isoprenylcysteine carboxylmethyltransferase family protein [Deltaproteobacteria bacterium]|nr:isoprenylcysteine carboxylmethyltransferase family protein [Deltaproteobacteria bacterium]
MAFLPWILHLLFWFPFVARGQIDRATGKAQSGPAAHRASAPSLVVWLHGAALFPTYFGMGAGSLGAWVYGAPLAARLLGVPLFLGATALVIRTLLVFRSWRLRAELTADHELCTGGPFAQIRHPIYTAMALLTVGTALLVPNPLTLLGVLLNFAAGDYRARQEEKLLVGAFGQRYLDYMGKTRRFVPGVY